MNVYKLMKLKDIKLNSMKVNKEYKIKSNENKWKI